MAFVMSLTRLSSRQVFMPVIVALHLSLLSASGALLLRHHRFRGWTLMALAILSCSAEFNVGTIYQLIAQVFGLSLFAACAVLLMVRDRNTSRSSMWKQAGLVAVMFSAAMVVYTEMIPFLAFACVLYWGVQLLKSRFLAGAQALLIAAILMIVFLNSYVPSALMYMVSQARHGSGHFASVQDAPVLFPFFLLPSGMAQFWGIAPFNSIPSEPLLSAGIVLGGIPLLISAVVSLLEASHGVPAAFVTAGMFVGAIVLAFKQSDYGLFKLAMFIQPFLIPTLVGAWMRFTESKQSVRLA